MVLELKISGSSEMGDEWQFVSFDGGKPTGGDTSALRIDGCAHGTRLLQVEGTEDDRTGYAPDVSCDVDYIRVRQSQSANLVVEFVGVESWLAAGAIASRRRGLPFGGSPLDWWCCCVSDSWLMPPLATGGPAATVNVGPAAIFGPKRGSLVCRWRVRPRIAT